MTFSLAGRCERTGMVGHGRVVVEPGGRGALRARAGRRRRRRVAERDRPAAGPAHARPAGRGRAGRRGDGGGRRGAPHVEHRQLTAVDAHGRTGASGRATTTLGAHGTAARATACVAAGNLLASEDVPGAMVRGVRGGRDGELWSTGWCAALEAGLAAGGEEGPVRSAGLLVADA